MTKVIMHIDNYGEIFFDCLNHNSDYDICTIISTLCNVLVVETIRAHWQPKVYEPGHVTIEMSNADEKVAEVFRAVLRVFEDVQEQHPNQIKIY